MSTDGVISHRFSRTYQGTGDSLSVDLDAAVTAVTARLASPAAQNLHNPDHRGGTGLASIPLLAAVQLVDVREPGLVLDGTASLKQPGDPLRNPDPTDDPLHGRGPVPDRLAFWRDPTGEVYLVSRLRDDHPGGVSWGIYLDGGGAESEAAVLAEDIGINAPAALVESVGFLIAHEVFHGHAWAVRGEIGERLGIRVGCGCRPYCMLEEAAAQAFALRWNRAAETQDVRSTLLRLRSDEAETVAAWFERRVATGLPGYCDGAQAVDDDAFHSLLNRLLEHWGAPQRRIRGVWSPEMQDWGLDEIPVHAYGMDSGAGSRHQWGFRTVQ